MDCRELAYVVGKLGTCGSTQKSRSDSVLWTEVSCPCLTLCSLGSIFPRSTSFASSFASFWAHQGGLQPVMLSRFHCLQKDCTCMLGVQALTAVSMVWEEIQLISCSKTSVSLLWPTILGTSSACCLSSKQAVFLARLRLPCHATSPLIPPLFQLVTEAWLKVGWI